MSTTCHVLLLVLCLAHTLAQTTTCIDGDCRLAKEMDTDSILDRLEHWVALGKAVASHFDAFSRQPAEFVRANAHDELLDYRFLDLVNDFEALYRNFVAEKCRIPDITIPLAFGQEAKLTNLQSMLGEIPGDIDVEFTPHISFGMERHIAKWNSKGLNCALTLGGIRITLQGNYEAPLGIAGGFTGGVHASVSLKITFTRSHASIHDVQLEIHKLELGSIPNFIMSYATGPVENILRSQLADLQVTIDLATFAVKRA